MKLQTTILFSALLAVGAVSAQSDDKPARGGASQTITTALGSEWDIVLDGGTDGGAFTGACDGSPGLSIEDARSADGDGDMYDYAWGIWVDDVPFAPATFNVNGNQVTAGPESLSGLDVSMEYLFSDVIEAGRTLVTFTNSSGSPITVSVDVPANFGSDSSTTIVTTSSGDTSFTIADGWAITWDNSSEINTSVFQGPNASVMPSSFTETVFDCSSGDGLGATFDLTIPAGGTQALMFFMGIGEIDGTGSTDTANAEINAQQFSDFSTIDTSLTSDLTQQQLDQIVNWTGQGTAPPPSVPVPAMSSWSLITLILLMLGIPAFIAIRR
jgi:hypothetical protein